MIGNATDPQTEIPGRVLNMRGAFELAAAILDDVDGSQVIAVGRFLPEAEVTDASPWGVSVKLADGRRAVLWSPADVDALLSSSDQPTEVPERKQRASKRKLAEKAAAAEPAAGWLFGGPV